MSNKVIDSKYGLNKTPFISLWYYIQRLRDPFLVSEFQKYFGIRVISYQTNDSKEDKKWTLKEPKNKYQNNKRTDTQNKEYGKVRASKSCQNNDNNENNYQINEESSESSDPTIDYVIEKRFFYYLFSLGAGLGYELFYASFFPLWFWNIDSAVGRRLVLVWVIIMYFGQTLKDVVKWPRPDSPPVVVLEPEYAVEYGMPSTHAMVGSALPFSLVFFTINRYEYSLWIGIVFALFWCLLVCGSRLYLGMHSIIDILCGLLLTALLLIIIIPLVEVIDEFHLTNPYTPFITIPLIVFLATVYPKSDRWSPARGDTCIIMGSGAGILLGSWLNFQLGIIKGPALPPPFPILWPGYEVIGLSLLRLSIGIVCISVARFFGKLLVFSLLCYIKNLDPRDPKNKIRVSVEIPCKVITYMAMGLTITYLSPLVFRFLNIERPTMFTEI